ncbi:MAG: hypothetical protein WBP93_05155, partial [Pyrinomonadaceae bacterium]
HTDSLGYALGSMLGGGVSAVIDPSIDEKSAKQEDLAKLNHQFEQAAAQEKTMAQIEDTHAQAAQRAAALNGPTPEAKSEPRS